MAKYWIHGYIQCEYLMSFFQSLKLSDIIWYAIKTKKLSDQKSRKIIVYIIHKCVAVLYRLIEVKLQLWS